MRRWRVSFVFPAPIRVDGFPVQQWRAHVMAGSWEQAVLRAAAEAPERLCFHVLERIRAADYTVETC